MNTREFSDIQEKQVCKLIKGYQTINSGSGCFQKGDVFKKEASLLIECKTVTTEKQSISLKYEWIKKLKEEGFSNRLYNNAIAINFKPNGENYFVIDEKLFRYLVDKLEEDNN